MASMWATLVLLAGLVSQNGEGAIGPANRWTTRGGSPARSGAVATAPVRGPVEVAWSHAVEGTLEGEPLVWDDRVVIAFASNARRRVLRVLDLLTGETTYERAIHSPLPLEPSIWGHLIVVRGGERELSAYRVTAQRLSGDWVYRADAELGAPLLVGTAVYVCADDAVERLTIGKREPAWRAEGRYRGAVSLRGDRVYAMRCPDGGNGASEIVRLDRRTGADTGAMFAGVFADGAIPTPAEPVHVGLLDCGVFALHPRPVELGESRVRAFGLRPDFGARRFEVLGGSTRLLVEPVGWRDGWLARVDDFRGGESLVLADHREQELVTLADTLSNPDFAATEVPASVAGAVAYVGTRAFDLQTYQVLWRAEGTPTARAVPARETVLVPVDGSRLVALRRQRGGRAQPLTLVPARTDVDDAVVILRDGSVEGGDLAFDATTGRVEGPRGAAWDLADVSWLEDGRSGLVYAAGRVEMRRALERLTDLLMGRYHAELADQARRTNDPELIGELVAEAWMRGYDGEELERAQAAIDALESRPKPRNDRLAAELSAERDSLASLPAQVFWDRARALPSDAPDAWRLELVRATLELAPEHAEATAMVRNLLPRGLKPPTRSFDALEWLTLVEAAARSPVRVVDGDGEPKTFAERELAATRRSWRDDLIGFRSENLLILTPVNRPGAVARCLSVGEVVCGALGEMFGAVDGSRDPLVLQLFATQAEYLEHSDDPGEAGSGLDWTAGHFDPFDNVSRIYVPDGGEAFDSVVQTYAHELTHHWLRARCPRIPPRPLDPKDGALPGFWIVEGFASMVDEFELDTSTGTWWSENPQSRHLDLTAGARAEERMPWKRVLGLTRDGFWKMNDAGAPAIPSTVVLGRTYQATGRHLFYAQSAAACRYLYHAEGGKHRAALLDYVVAYYNGDADALDVRKAFGMDAGELGRRAVEYAATELR